jgi:UDP:flavonoid glycosyltransferase YjiC (YdhE family)
MLPFVGLGAALRARGHDVTVIGSGAGVAAVRQEGLGYVDLDGPEARRELSAPDATGARSRALLSSLGPHAVWHMRGAYRLLAERYEPGETVVVAPSWLFGARIAQEKLGVPLATVHLQPLLFGSAHDPTGPLRWAPRWGVRLVNALVERLVDWGLAPAINAFRAELRLPPVRRQVMRWWRSPELVIGFFPEWFSAPQPDWPSQALLAGFPLYDAPRASVSPGLEQFLASGDPPLVFTQASVVRDDKGYFEAAVEIAHSLGRRAVFLTAHPEQVPRPLPPDIGYFGFVPLSALLPRAAALVHHGGMGALGQALAAGVPQLTVPRVLDQFDNSRRLLRLGVSANVRASAFRPARVARLLRGLLESPAVAARCRHYAARQRAETPFATACLALERLHERRAGRGHALNGELTRIRGQAFGGGR